MLLLVEADSVDRHRKTKHVLECLCFELTDPILLKTADIWNEDQLRFRKHQRAPTLEEGEINLISLGHHKTLSGKQTRKAVETSGFEPPTSRVQGGRSPN